jgi:hypothetical protein
MHKSSILAVMLILMTLVGCAGNMALVKGQSEINTTDKSLVLLSVKISNQNKPGYQPELTTAVLIGSEKQTINIRDGLVKEENDKHKNYLLSFTLTPGSYVISELIGNYKIPLLLNAHCEVPLKSSIEVKPNSITYLGHVDATIVERKNDTEERAGGMIPLLDQGLAGFSTGTFVVKVEDRYDEDLAAYRSEFPGLKPLTIAKAILVQGQLSAANPVAK